MVFNLQNIIYLVGAGLLLLVGVFALRFLFKIAWRVAWRRPDSPFAGIISGIFIWRR